MPNNISAAGIVSTPSYSSSVGQNVPEAGANQAVTNGQEIHYNDAQQEQVKEQTCASSIKSNLNCEDQLNVTYDITTLNAILKKLYNDSATPNTTPESESRKIDSIVEPSYKVEPQNNVPMCDNTPATQEITESEDSDYSSANDLCSNNSYEPAVWDNFADESVTSAIQQIEDFSVLEESYSVEFWAPFCSE